MNNNEKIDHTPERRAGGGEARAPRSLGARLLWSPWGRLLTVLTHPRQTAAATAVEGRGFGLIAVLLAIEFALIHSRDVVGAVFQMGHGVLAAGLSLWSSYVHFALGAGVAVYGLGVGLYYVARRQPHTRVDLWAAASVLSYAWVPHTLLVAIGVCLGAAGLRHPLLPQVPLRYVELPTALTLIKVLISFGPTAAWMAMATRAIVAGGRLAEADADAAFVGRTRSHLAAVGAGATVLLLAAATVTGAQLSRSWDATRPPVPGDTLPRFALEGLDGIQVSTPELAGQVVLVDFWATWCPPCVASMPALETLHRELGAQGFRFVSVNVEPEAADAVRQFVERGGYTFPVYFDGGALQRRLSVTSYPTSFLVDHRGIIREVHVGPTSETALRQRVQALLAERD